MILEKRMETDVWGETMHVSSLPPSPCMFPISLTSLETHSLCQASVLVNIIHHIEEKPPLQKGWGLQGSTQYMANWMVFGDNVGQIWGFRVQIEFKFKTLSRAQLHGLSWRPRSQESQNWSELPSASRSPTKKGCLWHIRCNHNTTTPPEAVFTFATHLQVHLRALSNLVVVGYQATQKNGLGYPTPWGQCCRWSDTPSKVPVMSGDLDVPGGPFRS